jgi:4-diphosphocytidyl-2-C-methyl-D-erythritol kinase
VSDWHEAVAPAKLNLALVVGAVREDGRHEVVTVLERLSLADTVAVRRAEATQVNGFDADTLVRAALDAIADADGGEARFEARLEKRIPVAAGLGGGSSDAASALRLANELLQTPLPAEQLERIAASLGSDVPFFLRQGPQLATGDGTKLESLELPRDYTVVLALPDGAAKESTAAVYAAFDAREGDRGFERRRDTLLAELPRVSAGRDLALLPPNDLASAPLADELRALGAFRADVTGAGPVVYGLFSEHEDADRAVAALQGQAPTWMARPG